ncbi:hypothetical protein AAMO2058_000373500 [Amorphochlora amoebiformis]
MGSLRHRSGLGLLLLLTFTVLALALANSAKDASFIVRATLVTTGKSRGLYRRGGGVCRSWKRFITRASEKAENEGFPEPVKGDGEDFNPQSLKAPPKSFPPTRRTFQCVRYGEAYTGSETGICVDGLVKGCSLHISHWNGNKTPKQLYSDLSTEIALRFIKTTASREEKWDTAVVVNNHFDTDGVCSAFALLNPELAWIHRKVLVDAAAVGDFGEFPRMDINGLKLDATITAIADKVDGDDSEKYRVVLDRMESILKDIDRYEELWGPEVERVTEDIKLINQLSLDAENLINDNAIGVIRLPEGIDDISRPALSRHFGIGIDRFLIATCQKEDSDRFKYRYEMVGHAWAPTIQRPNHEKPYIEKLQVALKEATGVQWEKADGLTGLIYSTKEIDMDPDEVVRVIHENDTTLRNLKKLAQKVSQNFDKQAQFKKAKAREDKEDLLSGDKLGRKKKNLRY